MNGWRTSLSNVKSVVKFAVIENFDEEGRNTQLNTLGRGETNCLDELLFITVNVLNWSNLI